MSELQLPAPFIRARDARGRDGINGSNVLPTDEGIRDRVEDDASLTAEALRNKYAGRTSSLVLDATSPDIGVVGNASHDDSDAFEALLNNDTLIPDFTSPSNDNFNVYGVPVITLPPLAEVLLTRQMVIPAGKSLSLTTPAKGGARIVYTGASTGTNGAMTSGSKTLTGSGFNSSQVGEDIVVRGAGDGGSTLLTWIQTYTDSTHVVLAHAAQTTVSGATYIRAFSAFRRGDLSSDKRGIPYTFKGMNFYGGGVCFNNATKPVLLEDVTFNETIAPGVVALNKDNTVGNDANDGTGGVGYHLNRVWFNHCFGGYWHRASTAGLSHLEHVRFLGMKDIALVAASGFHHGEDIDFQGMEVTAGDTMPSMWIPSDVDAGGRSYWNNVRWGSEIFTELGVSYEPAYAGLVIGPLSGAAQSPGSSRPEEIKFGRVHFGGRADATPSATSAKHAIVINKMTDGISIARGKFFKYAEALIQENWVSATNGSGVRDQVLATNWFDPAVNVSPAHTAGIFSHGGVDWRPQPITQTQAAPDFGQSRQNLIPRSNQFNHADWAKTRCSVAQDITGPDGAVAAYTLTRTSAGFGHMEQTITGFTAGQPLALSVYAAAGTHDQIAFGLNATIGGETQQLCDYLRPVKLASRWERYWVMHPKIPAGATSLELRIYHDVGNSALTGGTVLLCQVQLEQSYAPGPYMHNDSATIVAALPLGATVIGGVRQSYGAAAPTTGRHEVGEIVWNSAPAAAGFAGWQCVTNGSPGTWVPFGVLGGAVTATTAQLTSITDPINTAGKYVGKMVYNTTTGRPAFASGSTAGSVWKTTTNQADLTPV